jgi:hypothetical protein
MGYEPYSSPYDGCAATECAIYFVLMLVWLVIAILVYREAEKFGMNGCLWAAVVFFFGLIGVIIYVIVSRLERNAQARGAPTGYGARTGIPGGPQPGPALYSTTTSTAPDPGFRDEQLDELIDEGRLGEARNYLREMIQMAREMNDMKGIRNYSQYEVRINKAAMDSRRRSKRRDEEY